MPFGGMRLSDGGSNYGAKAKLSGNAGVAPQSSAVNEIIQAPQQRTPDQVTNGATLDYPTAGRGFGAPDPSTPLMGGGGGNTATGAGFGAAQPANPVGGQNWYNSQAPGQQHLTDQQWLAGDSDYQSQVQQYNHALTDFMNRISGQKKNYMDDANLATANTQHNADLGERGIGEDFAARGMAYSGLFDQNRNQYQDQIDQQLGNIQQVKSRNITNADQQGADYRSQNGIDQSNAKRASLLRQAQQQSIIDQTAGIS